MNGITFPLTFEVYKPKERLQDGDKYLSKPEIAAEIIRELQALGFRFKLVLADSLYGESGRNFIKQSKNELGWADFRVTSYAQIQKWWEVVMSIYLLVPLS